MPIVRRPPDPEAAMPSLDSPAACHTIDDVLGRLDEVVEQSIEDRSRLGYFAALYREVTARVKEGIHSGRFEDGPRMERLDVLFAGRYLRALDTFRSGQAPTRSWQVAFRATSRWSPLVLQHLLLGMNAHIGLDLGIAAARTAPGAALPALKRDFDEITVLLSETVDTVQDRISTISPWMALLDRVGCRTDEEICTFCLDRSRRLAWEWAEHLAGPLAADRQEDAIRNLDAVVAELGEHILSPDAHLRPVFMVVRLREEPDVARVVRALRGPRPSNTPADGA